MSTNCRTPELRTTYTDDQEKRRRSYAIRHLIVGVFTLQIGVVSFMLGGHSTLIEPILPFWSSTVLLLLFSGVILLYLSGRFLEEAWYCGISDLVHEVFD